MLVWLKGFSGDFWKALYINSFNWVKRNPGLSALKLGNSRSSKAAKAPLNRRSGCFSTSLALTEPSLIDKRSRASSIPVAENSGMTRLD